MILGLCLALTLAGCGGETESDPTRSPTHEFEVGGVSVGAPVGGRPSAAEAPAPAGLPTWTPLAGGAAPAVAPPSDAASDVATSPPGAPVATAGPSPAVAVPPEAPANFTPPADIPQPTQRPSRPVSAEGPPATDPEIEALMRQVSGSRLRSDVRRLARFGTRHAFSASDDPQRGVGAAREWLAEAFVPASVGSGSQIVVQREAFTLAEGGRVTGQENVVATLTGIGRRKRLVYVGAHYDSRTADLADAVSDAPGADDNASGVAGLLELSRVLGARQWDASIRLIAFAAEEQGMRGSRHHAPRAREMGLPIEAMLNLDVIGGGPDGTGAAIRDRLRVFSAEPDDGPSRQLARTVAMIAQRYGPLSADVLSRPDRDGRQSDHVSFSEAGFAAARLISASEDTGRQHSPEDTMERMDAGYHADVLRLTVALVANLALAPETPANAPQVAVAADRAGTVQVTPPAPSVGGGVGHWVAWRMAGEPTYRGWTWSAGAPVLIEGLPTGATVSVSTAAADDAGHTSRFGPEASVILP